MSINTISRRLNRAGLDQEVSEAIAEEITHVGEDVATKSDIAELSSEMRSEMKLLMLLAKIQVGMMVGLYIALAGLMVHVVTGGL